MSDSYRDEVVRLFQGARRLAGEKSLAQMELALNIVDSHQDVDAGIGWRIKYVASAIDASYPERAIVAFTWCLAQYDREPEKFTRHVHNLVWYYKWIVEKVPYFIGISRSQMDSIFEDMANRYKAWGRNQRAVLYYRSAAAAMMGDTNGVAALDAQWNDIPRDSSADCLACELNGVVDNFLMAGNEKEAIEAAAPLLAGKRGCREVPNPVTYCRLLVPLLRAGRIDEAAEYQKKSALRARADGKVIWNMCDHMTYFVLTSQPARAINIMEEQMTFAQTGRNDHSKFIFVLACRLLMLHVLDNGNREVKLALPDIFPLYQQEAVYSTDALAAYFLKTATELAARFDARNGNSFYSGWCARNDALLSGPKQ